MMVSVDLTPDEHKLIEIVRDIKRATGFGEAVGSIEISGILKERRVVDVRERTIYRRL